jgi:hypothetical protein
MISGAVGFGSTNLNNYTISYYNGSMIVGTSAGFTTGPIQFGDYTNPATTINACGATVNFSTTVTAGGTSPFTYSLNTNGVNAGYVPSSGRYFDEGAGIYYIYCNV